MCAAGLPSPSSTAWRASIKITASERSTVVTTCSVSSGPRALPSACGPGPASLPFTDVPRPSAPRSPRIAHRQTTGHARRLPQTPTEACPMTSAPGSPRQSPPPAAWCGSAVAPDPTRTPPRSLPMRRNLSQCSPDEGTSRQPASFFHGPGITGASHGKRRSRAADGRGRAGLSACAIPVRNARRGPTAGHFSRFRPGPCPRPAAGLRSVKELDRVVNRTDDSCVS
jgi:hypothetical protein